MRQARHETARPKPVGLAGGVSLVTTIALFSVVTWIAADSLLMDDRNGPFINTAKVAADSEWT